MEVFIINPFLNIFICHLHISCSRATKFSFWNITLANITLAYITLAKLKLINYRKVEWQKEKVF